MNTYTSRTICHVVGVQERTLRAWQLRGLLNTDADSRAGSWRRYTFADAVAVALMSQLVRAGFKTRYAAECANDNRKHFATNPLRESYIVVQSTQHTFGYQAMDRLGDVSRLFLDLPGAGTITIIALHQVAREIRAKLEEIVAE